MTTRNRPRCVLLDAGPIIGLHEQGLWRQFVGRFDVVVAQTVYEDEALFHSTDEASGFSERIDLAADLAQGLISVESADTAALLRVGHLIEGVVIIHDGELESLAIMHERDGVECVFCSADGAAVQAAAFLGFADQCVSLEELLQQTGMGRPVEHRFSGEFCEKHKRRGQEQRLYRA